MISHMIKWLKKIPIDLGQESVADRTMGKKIALSLLPDGVGKSALDIGAREGVQTRILEEKGFCVTSVDVDVRFDGCIELDVNDPLPFEAQSFDLVWSSEVIEHLECPAEFMQEINRVLKPGGVAILTTPNSGAWFFRLFKLFGLPPEKLQRDDHIHFFDIGDIRELAPTAKIYGYFPYLLVKRVITRGLGLLTPTFVMHIVKPSQ